LDEQECIANQWASEAITFYASRGHFEPPPLTEEPFFGQLLTRYLDNGLNSGAHWAEAQRYMLEHGLIYRNAVAGIEISKEKDFHTLSLAGQEGDVTGQRLNEFVHQEQMAMQAAFERAERCEQVMREVIEKNTKIRIVYSFAKTEKKSVEINPEVLLKHGPFIWVIGTDVETGHAFEMRIDRIESLSSEWHS
jgi:hypothetical protein